MAQWYVNELSKLTDVSKRTLHHYDRIGLLKPSVRLENGYRLYSESDLLTLQRIIALKFFGFDLNQIKVILNKGVDVLENFSAQSKILIEKADNLLEASKNLDVIIQDCRDSQSIPWKKVIELIEVYRMTQQLEHAWAVKVLNEAELRELADFEKSLKTRYTESQKQTFEKKWAEIAKEVEANLHADPESELGHSIGKRCMELVNGLYGKKYFGLRNTVWQKGFKEGHIDKDRGGLNPTTVEWLDKAVNSYYRSRVYSVLKEANSNPSASLLASWNDLLEDMFGYESGPKKEFCRTVMQDETIGKTAKKWLESTLVA